MSAPPPMPKSPAKTPVTNPPTTINAASSRSSLTGTPKIMCCSEKNGLKPVRPRSRRRDVRHPRLAVQHSGERSAEGRGACARFDGLGRKMAAKAARTGDAAEQAEDMSRDSAKARAACELTLDVWHERLRRSDRRGQRRGFSEQDTVDVQ